MLINQRRILHFILRGRKTSEYPISEYPNKNKTTVLWTVVRRKNKL